MSVFQAQGQQTDLALHTLGWKSFQDVCAHVLETNYNCIVEIYREAQDGGQDAVFVHRQIGDRSIVRPGTAQCKFYGNSAAKLRRSDLNDELITVAELVKWGQASSYILMTNANVDGPTAAKIKDALIEVGVEEPHVLGREHITFCIKSSSRLRALVPRVYGLGDLSSIIDQRVSEQTVALLESMMPTLKVYVPTSEHLKAVRALNEHQITLLVGNPATGKSSVAAILSTIAAEDANHRCFKVTNPEELVRLWNPHEKGGFYWIDDAFGSNYVRDDYVNSWMEIMPVVQAAIAKGNTFVLTSRRHIYENAKQRMRTRNHPKLANGSALVDVDVLSADERQQILYNHLKLGSQRKALKSVVKMHSDKLKHLAFLPEACRRLANPDLTKGLALDIDAISNFLTKPKEHLVEVIKALVASEWAALVLVFLHQGIMQVAQPDPQILAAHFEFFGFQRTELLHAISSLKGSFLKEDEAAKSKTITYFHPTIADAISEILSKDDGMGVYFLMGAKPLSILKQVICTDAPEAVPDTLLIARSDEVTLFRRLRDLPDERSTNQLLFSFLCNRASPSFFKAHCEHDTRLLSRKTYQYSLDSGVYDPRLKVAGRMLTLGILDSEDRESLGDRVQAEMVALDFSFLEDEETFALATSHLCLD